MLKRRKLTKAQRKKIIKELSFVIFTCMDLYAEYKKGNYVELGGDIIELVQKVYDKIGQTGKSQL